MGNDVFSSLSRLEKTQASATVSRRRRHKELMRAIAREEEKDYSFYAEEALDDAQRAELQTFFRKASKYYHYVGRAEDFTRDRRSVLGKLGAFLFFGALAILMTTLAFGTVSLLSLLELAFLGCLVSVLVYVSRAQYVYEHTRLAASSVYRFELSSDLLCCPAGVKWPYRLFTCLAALAAIGNIVLLFCFFGMTPTVFLAVTCEAVLFFVAVLALPTAGHFFDGYGPVYFGGHLASDGYTVLVYDRLETTVRTKDDFEEKFPFMKE